MYKTLNNIVLGLSLFASILFSSGAGATDVSKVPLIPSSVAKPNVIFGLDDSGSMDFEVMLNTNDGAFWWNDAATLNGVTGAGWDASGTPLFNSSGNSGSGWTKLAYLSPNGCGADRRILCDSSGHYGIAPTYQFAWTRSSGYNPLYYNPAVTYTPWISAYMGGATKTFTAPVNGAALTHPLYAAQNNVGADSVPLATPATDTYFMIRPGMVLPAGVKVKLKGGGSWVTNPTKITVPTGTWYYAAITYYPATYWQVETCAVDNLLCTRAPDGKTLKRYEVKSGNTFPGGRTYAAELQNFANWYTFYRKRKLMLASSASLVLDSLTGMKIGVVHFNAQSAVTMADTDSTDVSKNAKTIIGQFYSNASSGGTPTRETLKYINEQFRTRAGTLPASDTSSSNIVSYSCQKNAAFIMTDGYAYANTVSPPSYTSASYGGAAPYTTTYSGTLADIALSYYTNTITGTALVTGKVPSSAPTTANPQNDGNANLHVNTYAMTLGAKGTLWPTINNAYTSSVVWPNPSVDRSPTAVDDLWHATVNGRGQMFTANTPRETVQSISSGLANILSSSGSQSAVAFSTVNLKVDEAVGYVGSYTPIGWAGDISAYGVDTATGAIQSTNRLWSADALLQARDYTTRALATSNAGAGAVITANAAWSSLVSASRVPGTLADFLSYTRGDRTKEATTYRTRTGILGAVVNAEPVSWLADKVVYAASNEGFLHAFDKTTGAELWAFAPSFVLGDIADKSKIGTAFSTVLDGTPAVARVGTKTILAGGRGTAGTGYYALDVTNPKGSPSGTGSSTQTDSVVAQRFLWEFPNASTPSTVVATMGTSTGKPLLVKTARWGDVVMVTSGYNNTSDGKGRIYVLNATTGELLDTMVTPAGTLGAEAGLSGISGFLETDSSVQYVYGGDLLGNLWKFNVETSAVSRLATLTNSANKPLQVTAAPDLATFNGRRMVFIGTGKMLGTSDFSDSATNTFFGLWDNGAEINPNYVETTSSTNLRKFLAPRAITVAANGIRTATGKVPTGDSLANCTGTTKTWTSGICYTNPAIDYVTQRGWYVEMPAGEKLNTDPTVGLGMVSWVSNSPSLTSCTSSSALYFADAETGLQLDSSAFISTPAYGISFATTLTSRPVISRLPSGKVVVTTHQSNNTTDSRTFNMNGSETKYVKKAKIAWKQILQ